MQMLRRASLFFFCRILAFWVALADNKGGNEVMTVTFETVLTVFRDYLLQDSEEEVLPCRRGYVRVSWNHDSRYCVDGILCRTPEELFDLLLQDYRDFALIRRTLGRRDATEADEKAVDELCQPYLDWRKEALK